MSEIIFITEMREYISLAEELNLMAGEQVPDLSDKPSGEPSDEPVGEEHPAIDDLRNLAFKLRAHTENDDGEYSLGVEMGMQRAADMIENLIRRHTEGE